MPRLQRIVIPGVPHHVVQWGNNGQPIFQGDEDREAYLAVLARRPSKACLEIWAYCLMDTHIHLVVTPMRADSLARGIGQIHSAYAQDLNRRTGRRGHLWDGRYYSCALGRSHFRQAVAYVEQNPARKGIVKLPWQYPWSSAAQHVAKGVDVGVLDLAWWRKRISGAKWQARLRRRLGESEMSALQRHTKRGWPWAGERALETYEKIAGCRVRPLPVGRPKAEQG